MMTQDDPRRTPGKAEPHYKAETMKGTTKMRKSNKKVKVLRCREQVPKGNPEPIYSGYSNVKNKASKRVVKKKRKKLKKQNTKA
jgi:hypothetical protein